MNVRPAWFDGAIETDGFHIFGVFSASEDMKILELFSLGHLDASIAAALGREPKSVRERRIAINAMRRPSSSYTEAEDTLVRDLHGAGVSDDEIARQLGRPAYSIGKRRRILGIIDRGLAEYRKRSAAQRVRERLSSTPVSPNDRIDVKAAACLIHLYELHTLTDGAKGYPNLNIPNEEAGPRKVRPVVEQLSYCGSQAALCCE